MNMTIIVALLLTFAVILLFTVVILWTKYRSIRLKYLPITQVDAEVENLKRMLLEDEKSREELNQKYESAKAVYDRLTKEVSLLEENLEDISFGLYRPHYTFETSEQYKRELDAVWEKKKALVRGGMAATCSIKVTIGNSRSEGERLTKHLMKVMLRAFNGECDAAVANVTWNNVTRMEERIRKSYEAINGLGAELHVAIAPQYLELSLDELRLTHEYEMKKHDEQEEQRHLREQMREEEKAQRELARAQQEASEEQAMYEQLLAKARAEAEKAKGEELNTLNERTRDLERKLAEAQAKGQRAKSMAQQTKQGHVYVISNIGSFGEEVFKIGMTRRLDPMDRVHELGDAAVPFPFDVHATIESDDAPHLEDVLHKKFSGQRLNLVNMRKEYFRANLQEIENFVKSQGASVQFTKLAEAREYRQTLSLRAKDAAQTPNVPTSQQAFPEKLLTA